MSDKLHITEIGRIAVPAIDQDRALEFYVGTLGFELRTDETFADGKMRWIEVVPRGGRVAMRRGSSTSNGRGQVSFVAQRFGPDPDRCRSEP